ncbi:MAG: DUF167 domain-containing protein [Candidatus Paceibacterota bacterium]
MLIKVKVIPSSKKESVIAKKQDSFEVCVREDPVRGAASLRAIEIIADFFNIKAEKVRLVKGFKQRNKIFEIPDIK